MNITAKWRGRSWRSFVTIALVTAMVTFYTVMAYALTGVNVQGSDGSSVTGYKWLIQEDKMYHVPINPGDGQVTLDGSGNYALDPNWGDNSVSSTPKTLSVDFHRSYMPVVAEGTSDDLFPPLEDGKHYFISILPDSGYSIGGAQIPPGAETVTVIVNSQPIPTTQITIFVHEDTAPINNVWDEGERGLGGFTLLLEDAGGKYGASAGIQSNDAFGNPLCTTYNADGTVNQMGAGCVTGPDGRLTVKNLAPGKYGVLMVPPNTVDWVQTSTIEGKKIIDAWVKADEPDFFGEFGPPGPHASFGFVPAGRNNPFEVEGALSGGKSIRGQVVNLHLSRPPLTEFYNGGPFPHTTPWVGLNTMGAAGPIQGVYAIRTSEEDGSFIIPNVPNGTYQLVIWDDNLDLVFGMATVVVDDEGCNGISNCNLGDVPVFQWFHRMENYVFNDADGNGFWDDGESPLLEMNVNLRWRDGTVYQAFPTDVEGIAPFDEVFPFFSWLVAEVDFARMKATGATITVDDGGAIDFNDPWTFGGQLNPQAQGNPVDPASSVVTEKYRTETGPVLTQAFQGFLAQTNVIDWGKQPYGLNENGGISGMVMYAVTRAEDDPEYAAAEPWEPGIPGVEVNLYGYDTEGILIETPIATTTTDSWDESPPADCQYGAIGEPFNFRGDPSQPTDCYDGMRNWNQVRPGVFDGGYAFGPDSLIVDPTDWVVQGADGEDYLKPGKYIVEVIPPAGYQVIKSHDRNVDFGDVYQPVPELLPPPCVGSEYVVAEELTLFPGTAAPLAGQLLNSCDRKEAVLSGKANAAADFFLFTQVPIAGQLVGFILDDTANEFDPTSPQFGEKYAPPFLPVSIRDFTGTEIVRTISDEYGRYNAMVPSTFTENLPQPSGISPNMLTACMNAKSRPDGSPDPLHNSQYSQFCYTFQYMPGSTTYLDTPVVPVAAFAGPDQFPLDCEQPDLVPEIYSVGVTGNGSGNAPYINTDQDGNAIGAQTLTITSTGIRNVQNPRYGEDGQSAIIPRDYGFGDNGTVMIGDVDVTALASWTNGTITVGIDNGFGFGSTGGKQLTVTRGDNGNSTTTGVTVQVGLRDRGNVIVVQNGGSIQDAIDRAGNNSLILVEPGYYNELVIMYKPVQLQGSGPASQIDAVKYPFNKLTEWRAKAQALVDSRDIILVDGQELGFGGIEPDTFFTEEGAGIFVAAKKKRFENNPGARIDGFEISGADTGGGVVVNGYATGLEISNLKVINNTAFFAGGIRVGHPLLSLNDEPSDAHNDYIKIHHNSVVKNGGLDGAGGGIAMHTGSDSYEVTDNFVCGNFTTASGAGIAHYGLSHKGKGPNDPFPLIKSNTIIFNENFNQGLTVNGGGLLVAGRPPLAAGELSQGSGSVDIIGNLLQGNSAGSGSGAGIQLNRINGQDIKEFKNKPAEFEYRITIDNNMIVNNVAAMSGGGISIQDALGVSIRHNTIAHNDNTSTAGTAFTPGTPNTSNPQPGAGIFAHANVEISPIGEFANPDMKGNIISHNRMFYWSLVEGATDIGQLFPDPATPVYSDLGGEDMTCVDCLLTEHFTGDADEGFIAGYFNGNRNTVDFNPEIKSAIEAAPALDEGGNFIRLRFGPLTPGGNYHIVQGSLAENRVPDTPLADDFDGDPRSGQADAGADEI